MLSYLPDRTIVTLYFQASIHKLQVVQNATARLLTRTKKFYHITPVLAALHWLPVRFRIHIKVLLLFSKAVNGLAPAFNLLTPYVPAWALRSSDELLLVLPRSNFKSKGSRALVSLVPKYGIVSQFMLDLLPA